MDLLTSKGGRGSGRACKMTGEAEEVGGESEMTWQLGWGVWNGAATEAGMGGSGPGRGQAW